MGASNDTKKTKIQKNHQQSSNPADNFGIRPATRPHLVSTHSKPPRQRRRILRELAKNSRTTDFPVALSVHHYTRKATFAWGIKQSWLGYIETAHLRIPRASTRSRGPLARPESRTGAPWPRVIPAPARHRHQVCRAGVNSCPLPSWLPYDGINQNEAWCPLARNA